MLTPAHPSLLDFSINAWRHERAFHIEDAYKWLFQATLGGEHAISSQDEVQGWMDREWDGLSVPHPHEPMTVQLRPDGRLVRLNLRPFKAAGGTKQAILIAFVRSAQNFRATKSAFRKEWRQLGSQLKLGPVAGLTEADWVRLDALTRPTYPAIDHSPDNLKIEDPAYRVIEARYCLDLVGHLNIISKGQDRGRLPAFFHHEE